MDIWLHQSIYICRKCLMLTWEDLTVPHCRHTYCLWADCGCLEVAWPCWWSWLPWLWKGFNLKQHTHIVLLLFGAVTKPDSLWRRTCYVKPSGCKGRRAVLIYSLTSDTHTFKWRRLELREFLFSKSSKWRLIRVFFTSIFKNSSFQNPF